MREFGFFKGLPHDGCEENYDDYKKFKNTIPKEIVIKHIESDEVEKCMLMMPFPCDMFTGEKIESGLFRDGDFLFNNHLADRIGQVPKLFLLLLKVIDSPFV